jgi:hypothetical protein
MTPGAAAAAPGYQRTVALYFALSSASTSFSGVAAPEDVCTVAVFALKSTATLLTPATPSRARRTLPAQPTGQVMPLIDSVMVFASALACAGAAAEGAGPVEAGGGVTAVSPHPHASPASAAHA